LAVAVNCRAYPRVRVGFAGATVTDVRTGFVGGGVDGEGDDPPQLQKTSRKKLARDVVRMRRKQRTAALQHMRSSNERKLWI
jgi:hypothetical protein